MNSAEKGHRRRVAGREPITRPTERTKRLFAFSALPYVVVTAVCAWELGLEHPMSIIVLTSYLTGYTLLIGLPAILSRPKKPPVMRCNDPECFMCARQKGGGSA